MVQPLASIVSFYAPTIAGMQGVIVELWNSSGSLKEQAVIVDDSLSTLPGLFHATFSYIDDGPHLMTVRDNVGTLVLSDLWYSGENEWLGAVPTTGVATKAKQDQIIADIAASRLIGPGDVETTFTVRSNGTPVAGVECWISTDPAGDNVVAGSRTTNDFGQVSFFLDAGGSYYLWRSSAGFDPDNNPVSFTV